ncbi:MAG: MarR family transcriptional regulator [bacterium]|nr:MarR family transcriptional regulator [bacterium]
MGIAEDIKQKKFKSEFNKAVINLVFTNSWLSEKQNRFFKQFQLTGPQFNVLRILRGQYPNPATVNLIIERMLDRMSNASRIVDRLETKGLVKRTQCKNDRRAVDVVISESGLKLLEQIDTYLEEWEGAIKNLSEDECNQLNHLLDKMRNGS